MVPCWVGHCVDSDPPCADLHLLSAKSCLQPTQWKVIDELPEKFLVSISDVHSRYRRFQNTDTEWTKFMMTDYKENVIDEKTYRLRSDGYWGVFIGR